MRRPRLRNEAPGNTYQALARGVDRRRLFMDADDYAHYVRLLAAIVERQGWRLLCFCLMPNHVHLLIETPEPNLGNGMQWLHGRYARAFNARHERKGHLFEETYLSPLVFDGPDLVRTVRYIIENPTSAGLCSDHAGWPWCSHAMVTGRNGGQLDAAARGVSGVASHASIGWLAHDHLRERLVKSAGFDCYAALASGRYPAHY